MFCCRRQPSSGSRRRWSLPALTRRRVRPNRSVPSWKPCPASAGTGCSVDAVPCGTSFVTKHGSDHAAAPVRFYWLYSILPERESVIACQEVVSKKRIIPPSTVFTSHSFAPHGCSVISVTSRHPRSRTCRRSLSSPCTRMNPTTPCCGSPWKR